MDLDYAIPHKKDLAMKIYSEIKKAKEFSANQNHSRGSIWKNISIGEKNQLIKQILKLQLNYQTHPQAIYTSRLNFSKLLKPKNGENFEKELEELTKSTSVSSAVASKLYVPDF
ncbi:hypothetical protein Glove_184g87 [Diversispora epigaea]|uniref:Uncharacterized protein n=1 Tax=Diversispora epigaea TaxID=1348612 RepID=A0A397IX35_9GLOM|nr:hypothetical protein Glove_184g87 [Diversispora epigaea]